MWTSLLGSPQGYSVQSTSSLSESGQSEKMLEYIWNPKHLLRLRVKWPHAQTQSDRHYQPVHEKKWTKAGQDRRGPEHDNLAFPHLADRYGSPPSQGWSKIRGSDSHQIWVLHRNKHCSDKETWKGYYTIWTLF